MRIPGILLGLVLVCASASAPRDGPGPDPRAAFAEGLRAYDAGRFAEAARAFREAERSGGPSEARLHNLALSALWAGDLETAEEAASRLASLGGARSRARGEFLLGHVAFERCRRLGELARQPEAEPFAFDAALSQAERAREAWVRAALEDPGHDAARRNVERALLALEELARQRDEARARTREHEEPPPPPEEEEPEEGPGEVVEEAAPTAPPGAPELGQEELEALLERLAAIEHEKRELRRSRRAARSADVERDW